MDEQRLTEIINSFDVEDTPKVEAIKKFVRANDLAGLVASKILGANTTKKLWEEIEKNKDILYIRFPVKEGPYKTVTGIIMGACGNGKTSLMNNICGTVHDVGEGLHSKTRNITCERVAYLELSKFRVYDTPGTTSHEEVPKHASLLKASLTHRPVNVIFINIKYDSRGIDFIQDMQSQTYMVDRYSDHVVYLVSHVDVSDNPTKLIAEAY